MDSVVFVPSYGLHLMSVKFSPPHRLTAMAAQAMRTAVSLLCERNATYLVVSAAYEYWPEEARLQTQLARSLGMKSYQALHIIGGVTNSYNEALRAVETTKQVKARKLFVVADQWHAPRSRKIFRRIAGDLEVEVIPFQTPRYEATLEPSLVKSLRSGTVLTWILWNFLLGLMPLSWFGLKAK